MSDIDGYLIEIGNQLEKMGKYELNDIKQELEGIKKAILIAGVLNGKHSSSEIEKAFDLVEQILEKRADQGKFI